jgi:hypothetical protein
MANPIPATARKIDGHADSPRADRICLGPDLPMTVYDATERWHPERIGALALYCSDGRWGDAFDEFCHKHLDIPRYDRWAVPGGPAWLVSHDDSPLLRAARNQIDFLVQVHELELIVLITHFGCAYYGQRSQKSAEDCLPEQIQEARAAARTLRKWYPSLEVQSFLGMRRESGLSFHELSA